MSDSEINVLKSRLHATWTAGDFRQIAKTTEQEASRFVGRLNLSSAMKVLDVACGSGNLALPAAHAGTDVTGVDIAENLIEQAHMNAEKENLKIKFDVGDAENLPYNDASFDVVMTMFGAMFAPRPELAAAELRRVCRSGGTIAMANWTPSGFIGQMFKLTGKYVPPPNIPAPILWGDEETVRERFKEGIADLKMTRCKIIFKFAFSPAETVEFFRKYYGPTQKAFAALEDSTEFRSALEEYWASHNRAASDNTTEVEAEYLEVIAIRD